LDEFKIHLLLFMSLAGVIFYMAVAPEISTGVWALLGILAAVVAVVSLIGLKAKPELLLRVAMTTVLFLTIFAGVTWFYTRGRALGIVAAVSAPIAVGLSIGALRWRNPQ
jgi:hypothetical protein